MKLQAKPKEMTDQPKDPRLATRAPTVQLPKHTGRTEETIQQEKPKITNMGGIKGTADQETLC